MKHRHLDDTRATIVNLRKLGWSLKRIGRATGRHHTTVLYHLRNMDHQPPTHWAQWLVNRGVGL